jgi:hypothetical protein
MVFELPRSRTGDCAEEIGLSAATEVDTCFLLVLVPLVILYRTTILYVMELCGVMAVG